jgi:heptosyltransferase II
MRILIKAPNWVGDCVMATPAIACLRSTFPSDSIDALVRPSVAGVLLDNPHLTSVIAADDRKLANGVFDQLKSRHYDAVALMPNSLSSAWLAWQLGIPHRAGFSRAGRGLLLSQKIPYVPHEWQTFTARPMGRKCIGQPAPAGDETPVQPKHMVYYYLRIAEATARALGASIPSPVADSDLRLVLPLNPEAVSRVDSLLEEEGLKGCTRLVGINPGAAYGKAKQWPLENLAEAASQLAETCGARIVCTASRAEIPMTEEIAGKARTRIYRLGEKLDLRGLTALTARLALLVTNDSGAMHIAAAVETPMVAIFGPTDWNVTRPWSSSAVVVRESPDCAPCFLRECPIDHRCMTCALVSSVVTAGRSMLEVPGDSRG